MLQQLLMVAFLALLIAGPLAVFFFLQKQRRQEFEKAAQALGFTFSPVGDGGIVSQFGRFQLFSRGSDRTVRNLLEGQAHGCEVKIFDYDCSQGGDSSGSMNQTVLCFRAPDLDLPTFSLRPKKTLHKIAALFGYREVTFAGYQGFRQNYLLRGPDEDAIRRLFDVELVGFFDGYPGVSTEGGGPLLVFYRASERVDPSRLAAFLDEGFKVLALFR
jgi:hypothetical protein